MQSLCDSFVHLLVVQSFQVAIVFTLALLISQAVRFKSAHWRYWLWMLVIIQCVTPALIRLPVTVPTKATGFSDAEPIAMNESSPTIHSIAHPGSSRTTGIRAHTENTPRSSDKVGANSPTQKRSANWFLACAWVIIASLLVTNLGVKSWIIRRRLLRERNIVGTTLADRVAELAGQMGMRRLPQVYVLSSASQPFVWGWLRGDIYLPRSFFASRDSHRQAAVLKHELAHVHRWDAAWNIVQLIVQCIYFFHPLVWLANRRIRLEREKSCDEMVLAGKFIDPKTYCEAIVETMAREVTSKPSSPTLAVTGAVRGMEDRLSTILSPDRTFQRGLSWPAIALFLLAAACILPTSMVVQLVPDQKAANRPLNVDWATGQTVEVTVINATSGEAIPNVKLELQCQGDGIDFQDVKTFSTDANGLTIVALPELPPKSVRIYPSRSGFVPLRLYWNDAPHPNMPASLTIDMQPGKTFGGQIVDENGQPIPDVKVKVHYWGQGGGEDPHRRANIDADAISGSDGRWKVDVMPRDVAEEDLRIYLSHPDYVSDRLLRAFFPIPVTPPAELSSLFDQSAVMVMKKGKSIVGLVTDASGNPVANAELFDQEYHWFDSKPPRATTDDRGAFKITGVPQTDPLDESYTGPYRLAVQASGHAPQLIEVAPSQLLLQITLMEGEVLRGTILDVSGMPIEGASVSIDRWKETSNRINRVAKSDAQGRFVLTDLPAEQVTFSVGKEGYLIAENLELSTSSKNHMITLKSPVHVSGSIVDAESGKPVDRCQVTLGIDPDDGRGFEWLTYRTKKVVGGRYQMEIRQESFVYRIRVEADGYMPAVSEPIRPYAPDQGDVVRGFELRKASPMKGWVTGFDGRPLSDAEVYLATTRVNVNHRKMIYSGRNRSTKSDDQGHFVFPPESEAFYIVVIHPDGIAVVDEQEFQTSPRIQIQPWTDQNEQLQLIRRPAPGQLSQRP